MLGKSKIPLRNSLYEDKNKNANYKARETFLVKSGKQTGGGH